MSPHDEPTDHHDGSDEPAPLPFGRARLELEYPCQWSYKVIGPDQERMRSAIFGIVGMADHHIAFSRESRTGRYCSLELTVIVADETHRLAIFEALRKHQDVKFVL